MNGRGYPNSEINKGGTWKWVMLYIKKLPDCHSYIIIVCNTIKVQKKKEKYVIQVIWLRVTCTEDRININDGEMEILA